MYKNKYDNLVRELKELKRTINIDECLFCNELIVTHYEGGPFSCQKCDNYYHSDCLCDECNDCPNCCEC